MNVISLKDYAREHHISYEAVRKQVARYKKELDGHLIRDGRQQFLDEEAVAFLDGKRAKNPVAIIQMDKDEQIEKLKGDLDAAKTLIIALQQEQVRLKDEAHALALENAKIARLEADNEAARVKAAEAEENAQKAQQEVVAKQQEIDAMRKAPLWERIRGWKKKG